MHLGIDLDDTLLGRDGHPLPGAARAMRQLLDEGHQVTIWTARFSHVTSAEESAELKALVAMQLQDGEIPFSDICDGPKPPVDFFIGDNLIPFTGDWPQALALTHMMMQTRGPLDSKPAFEDGGDSEK